MLNAPPDVADNFNTLLEVEAGILMYTGIVLLPTAKPIKPS